MFKPRKKSANHDSLARRFSRSIGEATEAVEALFKRLTSGIADLFGMLYSLIVPTSLLKKVEDAGKETGAQLGKQVGEISDQVEKRFSKSAAGALDIFKNLLAILIPEFVRVRVAKVWQALAGRLAKAAREFAKGIDQFADRYLPRWLVQGVKRVSWRITRWLRSWSRFIWVWSKSRDYRKLAWSTPGVIMAVPLVICVALSPVYSVSQKQQHYNVVYSKALEEEDFDTADLFAKKLVQLGYQRMERAEYQEAITLARADRYREAYETMLTIAPASQPGFLFGHLWIAGRLRLGEIPEIPEEEAWRQVAIHTQHALSIESSNAAARYLKIQIDRRNGKNVIFEMEDLADLYPEFYGELWVHYVKAGEIRAARSAASRFSAYVEKKRKKDRTLTDYMLWASAQEMLGHLEESEAITIEGSERFSDAPELKQMAALVLIAKLKVLADQNSNEALQLLKQAHETDPNNEYVVRSLGSRLANDNTYRLRPIVNRLKEAMTLNSEVLLAAGDVHARAARFEKAKEFYLEACEYNPASGRGYNNIAWIYANIPPVLLDAAFGAIEQALEIEVDPEFLETRGQIHYKRGRDFWDRAVEDLEDALNGSLPEKDRKNAHRTLAAIYDSRGRTSEAEIHRQEAEADVPTHFLMPPSDLFAP